MTTHDPKASDRVHDVDSAQEPRRHEWLVDLLECNGPQTLDALGAATPSVGWAQLFLAVDRLSRSGSITLRPVGRGTYLVSLARHGKALAV